MSRNVAHRAARVVVVALAVTLLAASCASSGSGVAADGGASAGASVAGDSFCVLWAEMKTNMDDPDGLDQDGMNAYLEAREAAATQLPDELASGWDSIVAWDDRMIEIFYAVDFDWEALNEEMVSAAFGSVEAAEDAEEGQETAVGHIDRWVIRNCGGGVGDARSLHLSEYRLPARGEPRARINISSPQ